MGFFSWLFRRKEKKELSIQQMREKLDEDAKEQERLRKERDNWRKPTSVHCAPAPNVSKHSPFHTSSSSPSDDIVTTAVMMNTLSSSCSSSSWHSHDVSGDGCDCGGCDCGGGGCD